MINPPPPKRPKCFIVFWLLTICKLQDKCIHFSMKKKNETFCLMMGEKQLKRFHFFKKSDEIKTYIFVLILPSVLQLCNAVHQFVVRQPNKINYDTSIFCVFSRHAKRPSFLWMTAIQYSVHTSYSTTYTQSKYDIPSRYVSIYVPICIFKSLVGKRIEVSSHLQRYLLSFGEKILRDYTLPKKYYFGTKIWLIIVFFHSSTT